MFLGSFEATMDTKGRFTLPGTLREKMPDQSRGLTVTSDPMQDCLLIYTQDHWHEVLNDLLSRPNTDDTVKAFGQILMGNAQEVEADGNGRLVVPPYLRKSAQLQRELFIRGVGKKIEIWSEESHAVAERNRLALLRNPASRGSLSGISY